MRFLGARDDQQAGGVAVEAVDDSRPVLLPALGAVLEQAVRKRPLEVSRARMDDDAGRLVDDEQVLVLVCDPEVDPCGPDGRAALRRLVRDLLALLQAVALRPRGPVDGDAARVEDAFRVRTGAELLEVGEEAVQPRAGGLSADADAGDRRSARRRRGARRRRR
jgi:hypothetical protein